VPFTRGGWVFEDRDVKAYIDREMQSPLPPDVAAKTDDPLKLPSALIGLVIAHVAVRTRSTRDGHILGLSKLTAERAAADSVYSVFLPGLEEIKAVQRTLWDTKQSLLDVDFSEYEVHILHSTIPVAEQQAVFAPAPQGLQRIILATNIAETSVTIPNVIYVVDAGKCKEKRYDPERHLSMLVSAFTGLGNMKQRAGRAGRHRAGEYFSLVSDQRMAVLPQNQTVEMKRLDLSNV
jgi:RecG-like helicase